MKQNRQRQILQLLQQQKCVSAEELSRSFHVSIETVRRDLSQLEKQGALKRVYGGAVLYDLPDPSSRMLPWDIRHSTNQSVKQALALEALKQIPDGSTVALDSGTTSLAIADLLDRRANLTVITNDFHIALELTTHTAHQIFFIGGSIARSEFMTTGYLAIDFLNYFSRIDIALVSTDGFNDITGLSDSNIEMGALKSAIIAKSEKVIAVFDHSKFSVNCLYNVCPPDRLNVLITDSLAPKKAVEKLRQSGVQVLLVPVGESDAQ